MATKSGAAPSRLELISQVLQRFCPDRVGMRYIPPGTRWNNGYVEGVPQPRPVEQPVRATDTGIRPSATERRPSTLRHAGTPTPRSPAGSTDSEANKPDAKTRRITGAGTGFGHEVAMRLAAKGFDVIASVEIYAQVQTLKRQAAERGVTLQVEKLDVTNDGDRRKALGWDVEILVNNAGVGEGGAIVDIPAANIRNQWEVNVTGPLLLTQGIAKQMVKRGEGRIVWVSSREGLNVNPFTGIYSASKHAVEAIAETMKLELQEFGIEVATVNPGPFLTGFNDRMFETYKSWEDDPSQRLFDYSTLAFPRAQYNPEAVYATMTAVAAGEVDAYRNLEPKSMIEETKSLIEAPWNKKTTDRLGSRPDQIQNSYEMEPETPVP
jgi:short-subunit dehydrogenase